MLYLYNLTLASTEDLPADTMMVHPFYKTGFAKLSGTDENQIKAADWGYLKANYNMLLPIIKKASQGYQEKIVRFYDIRTTEEYSQPAPEYALLAGTNLNRVSPLGVKGMGGLAFPMALKLIECGIHEGETALVCCADLPEKNREACAFVIEKKGRESQGMLVRSYQDGVTEEDVASYMNGRKFDLVCEDTTGQFMKPFHILQELDAEKDNFQMLIVWSNHDFYGYVHLEKGYHI